MAFGRQKMESPDPEADSEAGAIIAAAHQAHAAGRRIFTCVLGVSATTSRVKEGGQRWSRGDAGPVIEQIEAMGWRLEHLDHVWVQTEHNAAISNSALIRGLTTAHMLFRRADPS